MHRRRQKNCVCLGMYGKYIIYNIPIFVSHINICAIKSMSAVYKCFSSPIRYARACAVWCYVLRLALIKYGIFIAVSI